MKIAFDYALPDHDKIRSLLAASGLEGKWDTGRFLGGCKDSCRIVAAYDRERLVGLGKLARGGCDEIGGSYSYGPEDKSEIEGTLDIVVLPDYRNRDIMSIMFKLLHPAKRTVSKQTV